MPGITNDLRLAARQLAANRGFTAAAILTLALGIGANTAIFTLVNAIILKSLPVADPQSLYRLGDSDDCCNVGGYRGPHESIFSYQLYQYLQQHTPEFAELAAFQAEHSPVGVRRATEDPEPFVSEFVSGNYFSMFGLRPYAGRLLTPADDAPGAPPAAVMSYRVWQQRYGSDPTVIGSNFTIAGAPFTIAGIAPPGFFGDTVDSDPPDYWLPIATEPHVRGKQSLLNHQDNNWLYAIGRLKAGANIAAVEPEINVAMRQWFEVNDPPISDHDRKQLAVQHIPVVRAGGGVAILQQHFGDQLRLLGLITGMVLLIACVNLANLQLARAATNSAQMSLRVALGAPRTRLVRQTLVESTLLAVLGGAAGLLVASWLTRILLTLAFHNATFIPISAAPSLPVMAFAFALSLLTGLIFGIVPAWTSARVDPAEALRGAGRSIGGRETLSQRTLIVIQTALSLGLVAGAGLMIVTLRNLTEQSFGFQLQNRVAVRLNTNLNGYAPEKVAAIYREIRRRVAAIPGVQAESMALYGPMENNNWQSGIHTEEHPEISYSPSWDRVSTGFFDVIGARLLRGRAFNDGDAPGATRVAVINRAFAAKIFPDEDPIGKRFGLGSLEHRADYQIVGIVDDPRFRNPRAPANPMFFVPLLQGSEADWNSTNFSRSNMVGSIQLRVTGDPSDLVTRLRQATSGVDSHITLLRVKTFRDELGDLVGRELLLTRLSEGFGALALLLAAVGLYGVTSYAVARRRSEIGVRGALGARRANIVALILRNALGQVALGVVLGLPAAYAAGRLLANQLWYVQPFDPLLIASAAAILLAAAALASLIPALRASSIDPAIALRIE